MQNYKDPVIWMDVVYTAFNESQGQDPMIDAIAFHWYDYGLDGQLTRFENIENHFG
jgi:hypothetical protein